MSNLSNTLIILSPAFPANESETVWVRPKQLFVRKLKEVCPSLEIIVLSFNYPLHAEQYTWKKVLVVAFNGMHTRKLRRLLLWWRVWKKLRSIKKEKSIVGILSFWCGECALVGSYFARIHKLKHFIWISGMDAKKTNKLIRFIKPREDKLAAMSVFLQNEFAKNHSITPKYIIPIGVDPTEFEDIPRSRDIDILGVGTLNPFKQYDALITLVKTLSSRFPQIKAVIIGEGTEREKLEQLVKELDLEANVTFTGLMTHTATLACMQRAKILIHPSAYEGFGSVCIEALFAGAHVISFSDPMKQDIAHWHIVKTTDEMTSTARKLLETQSLDDKPVLPYLMEDAVHSFMKLFSLSAAVTNRQPIEKYSRYNEM